MRVKKKIPSLAELASQAKREPIMVRTNKGEEGVLLSREIYEMLASDRQQRLDDFRKACQIQQ
jgi:PHD/YefM family antitoxin component YafN of YafNO toxin-antitoxin module